MSHVQALLLDYGGTLDSEGKHWSTQFAESFAHDGRVLDRGTLDRAFLTADRAIAEEPRSATMGLDDYVCEYAQRMLAALGDREPTRAEQICEYFVRRAREHLRGSAAQLAGARTDFRLALVSNFTANLPCILNETGLAATFDAVVCSAVEGVKKPDPSIFRLALDRLGVAAAEAVMIGDSLGNDIAPAKELGMTTVWLRGDRTSSGDREGDADHVVSSLGQAIALVRDLARGMP